MPEDTSNAVLQSETPSETAPTPETGAQGTGETPATTTQPASIEDALKEIDDLKSALRKARSDSTKNWSKAKELDDLKAKLESEKLSESEKKDKQLAELQRSLAEKDARLQEVIIRSTVQGQASKLGFTDPSDASRFLDPSELEFDDNGIPTNVEPLLKAVLKNKPYLAGSTQAPQRPQTAGGATAPAKSTTSGTQTITKEYVQQVQRGGPQAWAALPEDEQQRISAFIRGGGLFKR